MSNIRNKDIRAVGDILSEITCPFRFFDREGTLLYESPSAGKADQRREVRARNTPFGHIEGSGEKLDAAAALLALYLKDVAEKRDLASHTLNKYRELSFLSELSEVLNSSIEIDEILSIATARIGKMMGVENCSVFTVGKGDSEFILKAASGRIVNEKSWIVPPAGVAGRVLQTRKAIIANEPEGHPHFLKGGGVRIRSLLCIPLRVKEKTVGVLNLSNKTAGMFTSEDVSLLVSTSLMISGAIETAYLLEEKVRNEKFATIGQMAASIIHDIRNPISTIKGIAALLTEKDFSKVERRQYTRMIIEEVEGLAGMIEDLLSYSRGFQGKLRTNRLNVADFVGSMIPSLEQGMASRDIEVTAMLDYEGHFYIDAEKFRRAFFNIAGNAREAMNGGGRFLVLVRAGDDGAEIVFSDTGPGIHEDILATVFEPFVTRGKDKGTGLGLAIAKKIIEAHGGTVAAVNGNYTGIDGFNGANIIIGLPSKRNYYKEAFCSDR